MADVIETERLILRPPVAADYAALSAMWADPQVMADLGPVKSTADSAATIARHASYAPLGFHVAETRVDGAVIGFCGLKPGAPDTPIEGMLEVGWMLATPYWGAGYAFEAAAASIAWGWANRDDDRIVAITARVNTSSRRLMARLGMRAAPELDFFHSTFPEGDRLRDTVVYVIERPA